MPSKVKLQWITPKAEEMIVNIARVSNPQNRDNTATSPQLLRYLINHKHWSPFEMANMCLEIDTTRAISAQILRHKSFSFQEYSQRYAIVPEPDLPNLRRQDPKNRQASHDDLPSGTLQKHNDRISELLGQVYEEYKLMLEDGIAKETARGILPICSGTTLIVNGSIRSWLHYCDVRAGVETQLEHRVIAEAAREILKEHLPNIAKAMWPEA
jgi:thymidylate synthase (FAD)